MSKTTTHVGVVALALAATLIFTLMVPAPARPMSPKEARLLGPPAKLRYAKALEWKSRTTIRFFKNHLHIVLAPRTAVKVQQIMRHKHRMLRHALALKREALRALALPAHDALWECIHQYEGGWDNRDTGNNGHYGGLQMHPGWGYGTSYYASDDTPLEQKQAAERGYRASGYSRAWLQGQWGQTIGPCWQHA